MPIEQTSKHLKRLHYMLSVYEPWQLFRWTYDTAEQINVIQRFNPETSRWVTHDNDYLRDNFAGYKYDLSPVTSPKDDDEAKELATRGWEASRFNDTRAVLTET